MNLADIIELYIKALLEKSMDNMVLLRRNELAQHFGCAPSQINYVIQTRFNPQRGYSIESQRGGGGYIRLIRLDLERLEKIFPALDELGEKISQRQALDFLHWLNSQDLIEDREARIMAAVMDSEVLQAPVSMAGELRQRMLWAMVEAVVREE